MIDLTQVPDSELGREWMRRVNEKRRAKGTPAAGGRKKVLRPCPKCGGQFGKRELRVHKRDCKPQPREEVSGMLSVPKPEYEGNPTCPLCGAVMVPADADTWKCLSCGSTLEDEDNKPKAHGAVEVKGK